MPDIVQHVLHRVEAMHKCSLIAVDVDAYREGVNDLSSVNIA